MIKELYLCRHGATEWSKSLRHTGLTDLPLIKEGEEQAVALKAPLAQISFSAIYTSPLQRAARTAALAGFPQAQHADALKEWDYGEYEGKTTEEMRVKVPEWDIFDAPIHEGESLAQVEERARLFLDKIKRHEGKVLLFGSAHILRIMGMVWLGLPALYARYLILSTGSLSILGWNRMTPCIVRWNQPLIDVLHK